MIFYHHHKYIIQIIQQFQIVNSYIVYYFQNNKNWINKLFKINKLYIWNKFAIIHKKNYVEKKNAKYVLIEALHNVKNQNNVQIKQIYIKFQNVLKEN